MPSPVGVVLSANKGVDTPSDVVLAGTYNRPTIDNNKVITGGLYFTNTFGELLGGSVNYGSLYSSQAYSLVYYEDVESSTLVDASTSIITLGVNEDTLLLKSSPY